MDEHRHGYDAIRRARTTFYTHYPFADGALIIEDLAGAREHLGALERALMGANEALGRIPLDDDVTPIDVLEMHGVYLRMRKRFGALEKAL